MVKHRLKKRKGIYGRSKLRAFTVLSVLGREFGREGFLNTRELAVYSGIPYRSLSKLLPKWVRYEYVKARSTGSSLGGYEYTLTIHGSSWLQYARRYLPLYWQHYRLLKDWVNFAVGARSMLLSIPFNDMLELVSQLRAYEGELGNKRLSVGADGQYVVAPLK